MVYSLIQKYKILICIIIGVLGILFLLLNIRLVTISTNVASNISLTHSVNKKDFTKSKLNHKRYLKWGTRLYFEVKNNYYVSKGVVKSFPINPIINITVKTEPQNSSTKITSSGEHCVHYVDKDLRLSVVSNCQQYNNKIYRIKDGFIKDIILTNVGDIGYKDDDLIYVAKTVDNKYQINKLGIKNLNNSTVVNNLNSSPILINDLKSGAVQGYIYNN